MIPLLPQRRPLDQADVEVEWYGDASSSFGIGVVVGQHWAAWWWAGGGPLAALGRGIARTEATAVLLGLLFVERLGFLARERVAGSSLIV